VGSRKAPRKVAAAAVLEKAIAVAPTPNKEGDDPAPHKEDGSPASTGEEWGAVVVIVAQRRERREGRRVEEASATYMLGGDYGTRDGRERERLLALIPC
jgi:hypothetical protein